MKLKTFKNRNIIVYLALLLVIIILFKDFFYSPYNGLYLYYDDATNQVLRFYQEMWESVRVDGEIFKLWDWSNVLGSNYIASNSYYNLFSPFTIPFYYFSKTMIPSLLLYINMFKLFLIGVIGYKISSYYSDKMMIRVIVMIVLTFNGWIFAYAKYLFMWDAYVFMLMIVLGIEKYLKYDKCLLLFISTMSLGVVNYYFLYMFSFIVVIYFIFRFYEENTLSKDNLKFFFRFAIVYFLGILSSMVIFLPSIMNVMLSTRITTDTPLFISSSQLLRFFSGFFAEPRIYGSFNGFLDYSFGAAGWNGGMSFYSLMITPLLLPQILFKKRHRNLLIMYLIIMILVCIIPFYKLLCGSLESRWFIMIVIFNAYMIAKVLDEGVNLKVLFLSIAVAYILVFLLNRIVIMKNIQDLNILNTTTTHAYIFLLLDGIGLLTYSYFKINYLLPIALIFEVFIFNPLVNFDLSVKSYAYEASNYDEFEAVEYLKDNYDMNYRIDIKDKQTVVVYPMLNVLNSYNLSGFSGYHSLFNYNQEDFFNGRFKEEGTWYLFNQPYKMGLKNFLSNGYWIGNKNNDEESGINSPIGYELINDMDDGYVLYENKYPLDVVQFKDSAISNLEFNQYSIMEQDIILRNNVVVDNSELEYFDEFSTFIDYGTYTTNSNIYVDASEGDIIYINHFSEVSRTKSYSLYNEDNIIYSLTSYNDYSYIDIPIHEQVYSLVVTGDLDEFDVYVEHNYEEKMKIMYEEQNQYVDNLIISNSNIKCDISSDHMGYIVTTIPYDPGWSLKIDGIKTDVENINNGFVGAYLVEGNHKIELSYCPIGLVPGGLLSVLGIIGYISLQLIRRKSKNE